MVARLLVVFKDTVHDGNVQDIVHICYNKGYILYSICTSVNESDEHAQPMMHVLTDNQ